MEAARKILVEQGCTCVLRKDETVYTATERGVKPLVRWLTEGLDAKGFCAADKVVGKATAYLYVLLGVKAVYAQIMSRSAREVLDRHGITAAQDELVSHIINRAGTGICPFEEAVLDIHTPEEALTAIRAKMEQMHITL